MLTENKLPLRGKRGVGGGYELRITTYAAD